MKPDISPQPKFSANLGFLYTELPLPDAIRAAARDGFDAVECHFPYATPAQDTRAALMETGLPMLALNTAPGEPGEFGLGALPGRRDDARAAITQAIDYAAQIRAKAVHVMAGNTPVTDASRASFAQSLQWACDQALPHGITILIEPLSTFEAPRYFLTDLDQAMGFLDQVQAPNLKIMYDVYHRWTMQGDVHDEIDRLWPHIGHIQIAGAPGRGTPDTGEFDYPALLAHLRNQGWTSPIGAEYRPHGETSDGLDWLAAFRRTYPNA
jgi:hydroxypyruvate isomerase